ncbi:MAG TPA: hypothetical protein PLY56_06100 [Armatimonadota bacterium]|nr:hypothetical protein [Armatimonadota bacterium]HOJ21086.1 hypothetical protein [Armatimonadota bacterium]HOM81735.1 hypothetical protein [Armatimonadota bacterium]HPO73169.1 hypothetical protein [Armatimonadota bacterium]
MRRHRSLSYAILLAVAAATALLPLVTPALAAEKAEPAQPVIASPPGAAGTYQDRDGVPHRWHVNEAFALLWDGAPYLPAGMVFQPRSLAEPEKAEAWEADSATLHAWKEAGIRDVLIQPDRPATAIPVAAWQRLIDQLETLRLCYGIALPIAPIQPAAGYYVRTGAFRLGPLKAAGEHATEIAIPDVKDLRAQRIAAATIGVDSGALLRVDWAKASPAAGGLRATVNLDKAPREEAIIELRPLLASTPGLPDLWSHFGAVRDSLIALAPLKFGSGLRFFVHPLAGLIDLDGSAGYVVPTSEAYRLEFEAFLARKYRKVEALRSQWDFRGELPSDLQTAARLVPLAISSARGRTTGYLLDEKESRCYAIDPGDSRFWYDHLYFREHSLREQANQLAQFIGEQLADVPVVMECAGSIRYFHINNQPSGGFAGIGVRAAPEHVAAKAATAIGAARLAASRPWCLALALEACDTAARLQGAVDTVRQAGAKGWFVAPPSTAPAELPAWVVAQRAAQESRGDAAGYTPQYILFPHSIRETGGFGHQQQPVGADPGPVREDCWWIPTLAGWDPIDLGPDLRGFGIRDQSGYRILMWSPKGKRRIHLLPRTYETVEVRNLDGKVIARHKKGKRLRIDLSEQPVIITQLNPLQATPIELAQAELEELERLTRELGLKGHSVRAFQGAITLARTLKPEVDPMGVRQLIRAPLATARRLLEAPETPETSPTMHSLE